MALNILVIDDDKSTVERIMHTLKRADSDGSIGTIVVDGSITSDDARIEEYDPENTFQTHFDMALIDYQLGCSFSGILVSAWIALKMKIPRISLTTAPYNGESSYFDGFILKRDITDNPSTTISKIKEYASNYDANKWLDNQYRLMVEEYKAILDGRIITSEEQRVLIETLLDKYEKILDQQQEQLIKQAMSYEDESKSFSTRMAENKRKIEALSLQLNSYLEELKKDD